MASVRSGSAFIHQDFHHFLSAQTTVWRCICCFFQSWSWPFDSRPCRTSSHQVRPEGFLFHQPRLHNHGPRWRQSHRSLLVCENTWCHGLRDSGSDGLCCFTGLEGPNMKVPQAEVKLWVSRNSARSGLSTLFAPFIYKGLYNSFI